MKQIGITLALAFVLSGCIADDSSPPGSYYGPGAYGCEQYTSCGTCTPVLGCGWCWVGDKGLCAADPDQCATAATFSWTWESSGCPAAPDAGAQDAASGDGAADAGATD